MRITTRIAASGDRSLTRIPYPAATMADCADQKTHRIDRAKAQLAFAGESDGVRPFTQSSDDDEYVYFAAFAFCDNLRTAYDDVVADERADVYTDCRSKQDEICERRMERGAYVYVRTDISRCADGVRVKVSVQNPKNVVGAAEVEARTYAVICCQLWSIIAEQSAEKLKIHLHADEQVIADALDANRRAEERKAAKEVHDGHSH